MLEWYNENFDKLFTPVFGVKSSDNEEALCYEHNASHRRLIKRVCLGSPELWEKLADIDNPALVQVYEVIRAEDYYIVIEELPTGIPLTEVVAEGIYSEKRARSEFLWLCDGIAALHEANVSHGSICTDSITVSGVGSFRLGNYSCASVLEIPSDLDDSDLLPHYAMTVETNPRIRKDIYDLGVLLNVLLTGVAPEKYLYRGPLGNIVEKCICYNPSERFASVEQLIEAVNLVKLNID